MSRPADPLDSITSLDILISLAVNLLAYHARNPVDYELKFSAKTGEHTFTLASSGTPMTFKHTTKDVAVRNAVKELRAICQHDFEALNRLLDVGVVLGADASCVAGVHQLLQLLVPPTK